jgi:DNA-binding MarR family transcriptional regulator
MALLIANEALPFKALKESLEVTDGNLSTHLSKLAQAEYIVMKKSFEGKRPQTIIEITPKGRDAFHTYIGTLKQFIEESSE